MVECNDSTWTNEEIIEALTIAAKSKLNMSFDEFKVAVEEGLINACEYAEMIGLLGLITDDEQKPVAA